MPSRAFIAHDRIVTTTRMYFQMMFIGLIIGAFIYAAGMSFILKNISGQVPELVDGKYIVYRDSPKLRAKALVTYYVTLNSKNRFGIKRPADWVETEQVDKELRALFGGAREVPRDVYCQAIHFVTKGRVEKLRWIFPVSLIFFPVFGTGYFILFSLINRRTEKTEFVRGTDLVPFAQLKAKLDRAIIAEKTDVPLRLGEVLLPDSVSRRHMLVLGTSGTGKSVSLNRHITTLRNKPGKCIVYDVKGEFCGKHYDKAEDIIFYPFDRRSTSWNFFNEVRNYPDLDVLCTSLYEPPKDSKDTYWYNAARDVFRSGLFYLYQNNMRTNKDICDFFSQPLQVIQQKLNRSLPTSEKGALKHIDRHDSSQAASVISILQERISFFRYLINVNGTFSFRDYISKEDKYPGSLFLMNIRNYDAIFRPLMTFAIDVMIREVLSLPDSFERRITFLIDEFGSLAKLPAVFDFLTMARSKGGFLVIANQDLGSVANIYGKDLQETFFNNFNVHLTFRLNDPTTAEFLSKAFGEREVVKKFKSSSFSPSDVGDRFNLSEQEKLEKVVLATEFQSLPDFHTYLKIANYGTAYMETQRAFMASKTEEFVIREFSIEEIVESGRQAADEAAARAAAVRPAAEEKSKEKTPVEIAAEAATTKLRKCL